MAPPTDPEHLAELIDGLANALQKAVLLCTSVEPTSRQLARDAADLCRALDDAASMLHGAAIERGIDITPAGLVAAADRGDLRVAVRTASGRRLFVLPDLLAFIAARRDVRKVRHV